MLIKPVLENLSDDWCACSKSAAYTMFREKTVNNGDVHFIRNGIDIKKYAYSEQVRRDVRNELKVGDKFVVGHVGRFEEQKNHRFLLEIFKEIHDMRDDAILMLVGEGSLMKEIREKVATMGLERSVMFLGARYDVERLYPAMDVFCLPSLYEGLGIVLIEAQMSGLACYINDKIPSEVNITNLIHRISLNSKPLKWAEEILNKEKY